MEAAAIFRTPGLSNGRFARLCTSVFFDIWATAPYFHNGSVPSIELVLNSKARPAVWKRVDLDDTHYDEDALGWPWETPAYSQADAPPTEQKLIYDTSYWSQSNEGHTFGDGLADDERRAVIEYLKTL